MSEETNMMGVTPTSLTSSPEVTAPKLDAGNKPEETILDVIPMTIENDIINSGLAKLQNFKETLPDFWTSANKMFNPLAISDTVSGLIKGDYHDPEAIKNTLIDEYTKNIATPKDVLGVAGHIYAAGWEIELGMLQGLGDFGIKAIALDAIDYANKPSQPKLEDVMTPPSMALFAGKNDFKRTKLYANMIGEGMKGWEKNWNFVLTGARKAAWDAIEPLAGERFNDPNAKDSNPAIEKEAYSLMKKDFDEAYKLDIEANKAYKKDYPVFWLLDVMSFASLGLSAAKDAGMVSFVAEQVKKLPKNVTLKGTTYPIRDMILSPDIFQDPNYLTLKMQKIGGDKLVGVESAERTQPILKIMTDTNLGKVEQALSSGSLMPEQMPLITSKLRAKYPILSSIPDEGRVMARSSMAQGLSEAIKEVQTSIFTDLQFQAKGIKSPLKSQIILAVKNRINMNLPLGDGIGLNEATKMANDIIKMSKDMKPGSYVPSGVPQDIINVAASVKSSIQQSSLKLVKMGVLEAEDVKASYLHTNYKIYDKTLDWKPTPQMKAKALDGLMADGLDANSAELVLYNIENKRPISFVNPKLKQSISLGPTKHKQNLPEYLKEYMGEELDPSKQVFNTMYTQGKLINHYEFVDNIASGKLSDGKPMMINSKDVYFVDSMGNDVSKTVDLKKLTKIPMSEYIGENVGVIQKKNEILTYSKRNKVLMDKLDAVKDKETYTSDFNKYSKLITNNQNKLSQSFDALEDMTTNLRKYLQGDPYMRENGQLVFSKSITNKAPIPGYTLLPENKLLGKLSSQWVETEMANDLLASTSATTKMGTILDFFNNQIMAPFRKAVTAYNVPTHINNVVGDVAFYYGSGGSPTYLAKIPEMMGEVVNKGDLFKLALKNNVIDTNFLSSMSLDKGYKYFKGSTSELDVVNRMIKAPQDLYMAEDDVFKLLRFKEEVDKGFSPADAAKTVRKYFPYFDQSPAYVKTLSTVIPFVSFTEQSARIWANMSMDHPARMIVLQQLPQITEKLSAQAMGVTDEERQILRKTLPSYMQGDSYIVVGKRKNPKTGEEEIGIKSATSKLPFMSAPSMLLGGPQNIVSNPYIKMATKAAQGKMFPYEATPGQVAEITGREVAMANLPPLLGTKINSWMMAKKGLSTTGRTPEEEIRAGILGSGTTWINSIKMMDAYDATNNRSLADIQKAITSANDALEDPEAVKGVYRGWSKDQLLIEIQRLETIQSAREQSIDLQDAEISYLNQQIQKKAKK